MIEAPYIQRLDLQYDFEQNKFSIFSFRGRFDLFPKMYCKKVAFDKYYLPKITSKSLFIRL